MRNALTLMALLCPMLIACGRGGDAPTPARAMSTSAAQGATATVGDVVLQATTVAVADLNPMMATRYGIDRGRDGVMLLVTVRDRAGNGIAPGDLRLEATAAALPDAPAPLALRTIATDGMTDYIGVLPASPPASVQFRLVATRGGTRSEIATTAELHPRQ